MDGIKISIRQSVRPAQAGSSESGPQIRLQAVTLETAQPGDESFLAEVYASTRAEEMAITGWSAEHRRLFLDMRYEAERRVRLRQLSEAQQWVIRRNDVPAGQMIVRRSREEIVLMELALLPEHRYKNVGSLVMAFLMEEATQGGKLLRLLVEKKDSAAEEWFHRLGFESSSEGGTGEMVWRPRRP